ncbi:MAG: ribonuclease E/G [Caedimonas sp.]|nr:ribonuclease E/G [Caedimonas sp.]
MMTKRMIIDATHSEETRVALIGENSRLIDFDFESATKITIKGNIYLAKIARVEPSLQAAFVDYGGNRHGFLAFSEIHPDYFRIPVSDREALKAEMQKASLRDHGEDDMPPQPLKESTSSASQQEIDEPTVELTDTDTEGEKKNFEMSVAILGGETPLNDEDEFMMAKRPVLHQMYKIQEVIHKNQILLVQVVKEERGGKGAALTTFLSIAGRYGVLMPNSLRSGGISRKISTLDDRTRLKKVLEELAIPEGMGLIIRTAGRERTKTEIKRDAEFLMRAWNDIRDLTLQSIAPTLVYEEDDIIKRAIRDLYAKDVDEIHVEGEEGYKIARSFMKTLMPSHVKKVHHYKDPYVPLFHKFKIEAQIDEMYNPVVRLPSGGSIVIHPTEALVSIDINSGRSTRERHIEETAVKTNLEAADEIARQVRLRDLAGLIVIDFIDMDDHRYIMSVERRLREAFRNDRARIQMGKIGPFGLLELSRQRLRPSLLETSAHPCPHCNATGYVRSTESTSLHMLRVMEEEALLGKVSELQIHVPTLVAFYLLNSKREHLQQLEKRLDIKIFVEGDDSLISPHYRITRLKRRSEENTNTESPKDVDVSLQENHQVISSSQRLSRSEEAQKATPEDATSSFPQEETTSSETSENRGRGRRSRRRHHKNRERSFSQPPASTSSTTEELPLQEIAKPGEESQKDTSPPNRDEGSNRRRHRFKRNRRFNKWEPYAQTPQKGGDENVQGEAGSGSVSSIMNTVPEMPPANQRSAEEISEDQRPEGVEQKKKSKNKWWKRLLDA